MYIVLLVVLALIVYNFIETSSLKGRNKKNKAKFDALFASVRLFCLKNRRKGNAALAKSSES